MIVFHTLLLAVGSWQLAVGSWQLAVGKIVRFIRRKTNTCRISTFQCPSAVDAASNFFVWYCPIGAFVKKKIHFFLEYLVMAWCDVTSNTHLNAFCSYLSLV